MLIGLISARQLERAYTKYNVYFPQEDAPRTALVAFVGFSNIQSRDNVLVKYENLLIIYLSFDIYVDNAWNWSSITWLSIDT